MSIDFLPPLDWVEHSGDLPALAADEVHLWQVASSPGHLANLNTAEAERYHQISDRETALHYAAAQGGLRKILGGYLGMTPTDIPILREERGKPYVAGGPHFNITHTGEHILLAVALVPVGVDVEMASRKVSTLALARKFFLTEEILHLESTEKPRQRETFLRYWVCKEATVKLAGDGIYYGLRDAEVGLMEESGGAGWYGGRKVWLKEFRPAPGVLAALASWKPLQAKCFLRL